MQFKCCSLLFFLFLSSGLAAQQHTYQTGKKFSGDPNSGQEYTGNYHVAMNDNGHKIFWFSPQATSLTLSSFSNNIHIEDSNSIKSIPVNIKIGERLLPAFDFSCLAGKLYAFVQYKAEKDKAIIYATQLDPHDGTAIGTSIEIMQCKGQHVDLSSIPGADSTQSAAGLPIVVLSENGKYLLLYDSEQTSTIRLYNTNVGKGKKNFLIYENDFNHLHRQRSLYGPEADVHQCVVTGISVSNVGSALFYGWAIVDENQSITYNTNYPMGKFITVVGAENDTRWITLENCKTNTMVAGFRPNGSVVCSGFYIKMGTKERGTFYFSFEPGRPSVIFRQQRYVVSKITHHINNCELHIDSTGTVWLLGSGYDPDQTIVTAYSTDGVLLTQKLIPVRYTGSVVMNHKLVVFYLSGGELVKGQAVSNNVLKYQSIAEQGTIQEQEIIRFNEQDAMARPELGVRLIGDRVLFLCSDPYGGYCISFY